MVTWGIRRSRIDPTSYDVVRDRCWLNPRLDQLIDTLRAAETPVTAKVSMSLAELADVRAHPEWMSLIAHALSEHLLDAEENLRELAAAPSGDVARDADVTGLLAQVLVQAAWKIRGRGDAETVSAEAWRPFHQILEEAEEVGRACLDLVPGHPVGGVARMTSGRGLGLPSDEWWTRFEEARRIDPLLWEAHWAMMQAMCKKWYGSHEVMFDFARQVATEAPTGSPLGALLVQAHMEYFLEESWQVPATDLELMRASADRWLAGGEAALAHPRALAAHQLFAYGLREDAERARRHLSLSRGRLATMPWNYLQDGETVYRELSARHGVRFEGAVTG